jgi:hypothetical protein
VGALHLDADCQDSVLCVMELPLAVGFEGNDASLFEARRDFELQVKFSV